MEQSPFCQESRHVMLCIGFSTLTLMAGRQKGHWSVKKPIPLIPRGSSSATSRGTGPKENWQADADSSGIKQLLNKSNFRVADGQVEVAHSFVYLNIGPSDAWKNAKENRCSIMDMEAIEKNATERERDYSDCIMHLQFMMYICTHTHAHMYLIKTLIFKLLN